MKELNFTILQGWISKGDSKTAILRLPSIYVAFSTGYPALILSRPLIKKLFIVKGKKEQV